VSQTHEPEQDFSQGQAQESPRVRRPSFAEHVGIEILETEKDRVVGRIMLGPQHSNGRDQVHGGAIMSLADTLGAIEG
jgi:acyl-coenzyme A thioesterase PaaI-like protein